MKPLTLKEMEDYIVKSVECNPNGCSMNYLNMVTWNYATFHNTFGWSWHDLQKMLGRLLIEKKIDYTREGLWAPRR